MPWSPFMRVHRTHHDYYAKNHCLLPSALDPNFPTRWANHTWKMVSLL